MNKGLADLLPPDHLNEVFIEKFKRMKN